MTSFRVLSFVLVLSFIGCGVDAQANLKVVYKAIEKCTDESDMGTCLRLKMVTLLDRALAVEEPLQITDFMSLAKDADSSENTTDVGPPKTEEEIVADLPRDSNEKSSQLDEMIVDRLSRFLRTRSIQLSVPADIIEGRRKRNRGGMLMMAGLAMGGMMIQMAMGKIAMLAGKALLVGKMALLLSAIIGLKKLMGGGGGGDSHQVVYATESHGGGGGGHGWSRNLHLSPYSAYEPSVSQ